MHLASDFALEIADRPNGRQLAAQMLRRDSIIAENATRRTRSRGVSYGGLTAPLIPVPTSQEMAAAAQAAAEREAARAATADGEVMQAVADCERIVRAIHAQLDRVRAARARGDGSLPKTADDFTAAVKELLPEALTLNIAALSA